MSGAGLPTDPVEIAKVLLRQEGENRVLRLKMQEIKKLCEDQWDVETGHVCKPIIDIINRPMPEKTI